MARELGLSIGTVRRVDGSRVWVEVAAVAPGQQLLAVAVARPRQRLATIGAGESVSYVLVDEAWVAGQRVLVGFLGGDTGAPVIIAAL